MKKIHFMIIIVLLTLSAISLLGRVTDSKKGISLGRKLNVRSSPTLKSPVVGQLMKGDIIEILTRDKSHYIYKNKRMIKCSAKTDLKYCHSWYKIKKGNIVGWIYGKYLGASIEYNNYSNMMYKDSGAYDKKEDERLMSYHGKNITFNDSHFKIWFAVCSPPDGQFDTVRYEKLAILNKNPDSGKVLLKFTHEEKINNIFVVDKYLIIDRHWQCPTAPCNGDTLSIFTTENLTKIIDFKYIEHGGDGEEPEIYRDIVIKNGLIDVTEYRYLCSSMRRIIKLTIRKGIVRLNTPKPVLIEKSTKEILDVKKISKIFNKVKKKKNFIQFQKVKVKKY